MGSPDFTVVIPVFNKWELTKACLYSLRKYTPGLTFEVIVVDNASSDDTATELLPLGQALFGADFLRIRFTENKNYGPACNAGAAQAQGEYLFLLNNDTLLTADWAPPLLNTLQGDNTLGAVGPLLVYPDNTVQHLGVTFNTDGPTHLYSGFPQDHPAVQRRRQLQALTGAALLLPRTLFNTLGGFFEKYRNGFEDVDLSVRIRETGKALTCVPQSRIIHLESQSPGRHKAERYNGHMLHARCGKKLFPDLHTHGENDGFIPVINDHLSISLCMQAKDEASLLATAQPLDTDALYALTQKHPLWISGRQLLAQRYTHEGKLEASLTALAEIVDILPTIAGYAGLKNLLVNTGNSQALVEVTRMLHRLLIKNSSLKVTDYLENIVLKAEARKDIRLAALYSQKIKQLKG